MINWVKEAHSNTEKWKKHVHAEALRLSSLGYAVMPLRRLSKAAISPNMCCHQASSKKDSIDKWFDCDRGTYAGYNVGIASGKGITTVIDLDVKNNESTGTIIDGSATLRKLEKENSVIDRTMVVRTPSGGRHIYLRFSEDVKNGENVLAKGIDIRSGTSVASGGHVVAPPSVVGDKYYEWVSGPSPVSSLKSCPEWFLLAAYRENTVPVARPSFAGKGAGNENVGQDDAMDKVSQADALSMLSWIMRNG
jgi:hypothetical protein